MSLAMLLVALLLMASACGGSGNGLSETQGPERTAVATPTVSREPEPNLDPEDEVITAYMTYVEGYAIAVLELDATFVEHLAAGDALERIRQEIEELRSQGLALRVVLMHDPVVVDLGETSAVVLDRVINNSFYVDAETKDPPVASGSGEVQQHTVTLHRIDGRWVVVQGVRQR